MKREPDFNAFPAATFEDWAALAEKSLDGRTVSDALTSRTRDDLTIPPVLAANSGDTHVARQFPDRPWRITVRVDDPSGHAAAEQAVNDLEGGADALALVLPSAATADGFGICATDLELLDGALAGVDLSLVQVRLEPTWDAAQDAALMQALITSRAHAAADVDITFGFDPVGSLARAGAIPANWADVSEHLSADVTQLKKSGFEGPFAVADGRLVHAAGGTPAQELAFALATATTYLRALSDRNSSLDDADAAISFALTADTDQLATIAKFRAMRQLWTRIRHEVGIRRSADPIRLHAETSWRDLSAADAATNMLRNTIAAFSASVAGADSLTVLPHTLACGLPDASARRIARNTQMILSEESNLWRVQDPSAGSGTISALTEELCAAAWAHFQAIERGGGIVDALRTGDFQKQVAQSRAQLMADVASGATPMIGTSKYPVASIARPTTLDREARRYTRVARVGDNATRPNVREMTEHFASGGNRADVTARADIDVCAELPPIRLSEPFDDLRDRIRAASAARASSAPDDNAAITVPVVCLGPAVDTNRIAGSISEFLATAGIGTDRHVIDPAHSGDAGRTLSGADATIAFVCAAPETIEEIGDASIQAVRGAGVSYVIAAQTIADPGALKAIDLTVDLSGDRLSQLEAIITQIESTLVN